MNATDARLRIGATLRELLLDFLVDEDVTDAEYRELEIEVSDLVLELFSELDLQVLEVTAPFATVRLRLTDQVPGDGIIGAAGSL